MNAGLLLCNLILLTLTTYAQTTITQTTITQTIKGQVTDAESRQPLLGVSVAVLTVSPQIGAVTAADGTFRITGVPVGRHTLQVRMLGYESSTLPELMVGAGKEVELTIRLTESLQELATVTVRAEEQEGKPGAALNDMATVSARSFSVDQVKRYAAAFNDPARMAQMYAGVASSGDQSNALIIRGNSPKGVLWRMEGVEIPNPNHFAEDGTSGGGISALSVNVLSNSDFYTSAFPAEYGNATSGVFDLKLRRGNTDKREYAVQVGVLGADVAAEGPFRTGKQASYLLNYRYSTLEILKNAGLQIIGDAAPDFQDAALKLFFPVGKTATLSVWGMGGLSKQIRNRTDRTDAFHSDRGVLGANYVQFLSEKSFLEAIVSWSAFRQTYRSSRLDRVRVRSEDYVNQPYRASVQFNHKFNARHSVRIGGIVSRLQFNLLSDLLDNTTQTTYLNQNGGTELLQGYVQWKYRISAPLMLNAGLHATRLQVAGQSSLEPRGGLRWQMAPRHALTAGVGVHSRTEALSTYFAEVWGQKGKTSQANRNLALLRSRHVVLGYEFRPRNDWRVQVEVYDQHHRNVPIAARSAATPYLKTLSYLNYMDGFSNDSLVSEGTGRNRGVDFTLEKFLTNGLYLTFTASFYKATYTGRDGVERNARFDGGFVQNALIGKEWKGGRKKTNLLAANVRSLWMGGNRYIPFNLAQSQKQNTGVRDYPRAYEEQIPAYFRFDTRLSYTKNRRRTTSTLSLDMQNVFNHRNLYEPYYDSASKSVRFETQLGLVPILNWRLEF